MIRIGAIAVFGWLVAAGAFAQLALGEVRLAVTAATGLALPASGELSSDASQTERRFASGLAVELDDDVDVGDLVAHYGRDVVDRVDFAEQRVGANLAIDVGAGIGVWRAPSRRLDLRASVTDMTNQVNVVNSAGLFSGTAVAPPRPLGVRTRLEF